MIRQFPIKLWSGFLFILFSTSAIANECDFEVTQPVRAILNIIEDAITRGELNVESLEHSISDSQIRNPFSQFTKTVGNLNSRRAFARLIRKFTEEQKRIYLLDAKNFIEKKSLNDLSVGIARDNTADILGFGPMEELPGLDTVGRFAQGQFQGRPVFVTILEIQNEARTVLIDQFHPDPEKRLVPLSAPKDLADKYIFYGEIVEWKGRSYFVDSYKFKVYDLETAQPVELNPSSPLTPPPGLQVFVCGKVIVTNDNIRIVSSWDEGGRALTTPLTVNSTSIFDSNRAGTNFAELKVSTMGQLALSNLDGHTIFPTSPAVSGSAMDVKFYDLTDEPTILSSIIKNNGYYRLESESPPMVFSLDGQWLAYARIFIPRRNQHAIGLFDIRTGAMIRNVYTHSNLANFADMKYVNAEGHPYAIFSTGNDFTVFDMKKEEVVWSTSGDRKLGVFGLFKWLGETHILLSSQLEGKLEMRDLKSGEVKDTLAIPGSALGGLLTFEFHGKPMALVRAPGRKLILINLGKKDF